MKFIVDNKKLKDFLCSEELQKWELFIRLREHSNEDDLQYFPYEIIDSDWNLFDVVVSDAIINIIKNKKRISKQIANEKYWILTKRDIWIRYYLIDNKAIFDNSWNCRWYKF